MKTPEQLDLFDWSREAKTNLMASCFLDVLSGYDDALTKMQFLVENEQTKHLRLMYGLILDDFEAERDEIRVAYDLLFIEDLK